MTDDATWLREQINEVFGSAGQSAFARFLSLAGDPRSIETIVRTIRNSCAGRHRVSGELMAVAHILTDHKQIPDLIKQARRDPEPAAFELMPAPRKPAFELKRRD